MTTPQWTSTAGPRQTKAVNEALKSLHFRGKFHIEITDHGRTELMPFSAPASPACLAALDSIHAKYAGAITRENYSAIVAELDAARAALVLPEVDARPTDAERQERAEFAARHARDSEKIDAALAESKARFAGRIPSWADALIVAHLHESTSDSMSDYHGHTTSRTVLIGFRKGKREDFRQLRAAAERFPETAHLGPGCDDWTLVCAWDHDSTALDAAERRFIDPLDSYYKGQRLPWHWLPFAGDTYEPPHFYTEAELDAFMAANPAPKGTAYRKICERFEHRENYSMGHGNYLKAGHSDSSGWSVESEDIGYLDSHILEDGLPVELARSAPSPEGTAAPTSSPRYEIQKHFHSKRGFDFWLVVLAAKVDRDQFELLRDSCEKADGWYSRQWGKTPGGFAFKVRDDAQAWAGAMLDGQPAEPTTDAQRTSSGTCERCKSAPGFAAHYAGREICVCDDCREPALTYLHPVLVSKQTGGWTTSEQMASRLRDLADGMQKTIDEKTRPMSQNPTPKRLREYSSRCLDGANLERGQRALRALADHWLAGTVPAILQGLRAKSEIVPLVRHASASDGYYDCHDSGKYAYSSPIAVALQELMAGAMTTEDKAAQAERERLAKIERMEHALHALDIPGFFPTPQPIIERMLDAAQIEYGQLILEPSAGKGDIADAIAERFPHNGRECVKVVCIERSHTLRDILTAKGHELHVDSDFMECSPVDAYDAVILNPPFERGQDADHVRKAYKMVKPGGRVVAIVSAGTLSRSDRKATEFRDWLSDMESTTEAIDAGSFTGPQAFRQTGVSSAMIVIDKPPTPAKLAEAPRGKLNPAVSTTAERVIGVLKMANLMLF